MLQRAAHYPLDVYKHLVSQETGLCLHCADHPEAICARCSQLKVIHNTQAQLCKKCNAYVRNDHRAKSMLIIKIECAVCGKMRPSFLSSRAICRSCYDKERSTRGCCAGCHQNTAIHSRKEQLCKLCYNHTHGKSKRIQALCSVCGKMRTSALFKRNICRSCYGKEHSSLGFCTRCHKQAVIYNKGKQQCKRCYERTTGERRRIRVPCSVCGRMRISVLFDRAICEACHIEECNGCGRCVRCQKLTIIYNKGKQVCGPCYRQILSERKRIQVPCSVCGKMRISQLSERDICRACHMEELNGRRPCSKCMRVKVIYDKARLLCLDCHRDAVAPQSLRTYLTTFTSPYPYNIALFELLTAKIDWGSIDRFKVRQIREFGRFLQTYRLREPLTWEAIDEALPSHKHDKSRARNTIRAYLLNLGYALVASGELESRETYMARRNALKPIRRAPENVQPILQHYTTWLWEQQHRQKNVGNHLAILASFWSWCDQEGIRGPEMVHAAHINDYLLTLYWQWQCTVCQSVTPFDPHNRQSPDVCSHCCAVGALSKVKWHSQRTVRSYRGALRVFFDWATLNRMVISNPVRPKVSAPKPTIEHYSPEVIKELCHYIPAPDALILYLIIFHACDTWELRHAQLPTLSSVSEGTRSTLAESYYILIPKPAPSRGDRSPGRPHVRVDFPAEAASRLQPLLERYERYRQQVVKNANNRYLLFSYVTAPHDIPVGRNYVYKQVQQASLHVLGKKCAPNILRKTVGTMFADRAGGAVLRYLGWHSQQAFAYSWVDRILVHPQELNVMKS